MIELSCTGPPPSGRPLCARCSLLPSLRGGGAAGCSIVVAHLLPHQLAHRRLVQVLLLEIELEHACKETGEARWSA